MQHELLCSAHVMAHCHKTDDRITNCANFKFGPIILEFLAISHKEEGPQFVYLFMQRY